MHPSQQENQMSSRCTLGHQFDPGIPTEPPESNTLHQDKHHYNMNRTVHNMLDHTKNECYTGRKRCIAKFLITLKEASQSARAAAMPAKPAPMTMTEGASSCSVSMSA